MLHTEIPPSRVHETLRRHLLVDGYPIVVDLEQVEFLDSTGLGVLVGGLKRAKASAGSFVLVCDQPRLLKIFRITGLEKVFELYPTVTDALGGAR